MPFKNSAVSSGKKPALAPRSAGSMGKHLVEKKRASSKRNAKPAASKNVAKRGKRHPAAFSTLKSRQQAVQRAKLQIWRHLEEINGAVIKLAESGSYLAARTLFDFAGVYSMPPLEEEMAASALSATASTEAAGSQTTEKMPPQPVNRVEAFLKTLGLDTLAEDEPEPDVAA